MAHVLNEGETPVSLLERLRRPDEAEAWSRFVELYTPLLYLWTRRVGLQEQDAADLVQDVMLSLVKILPTFEYDPRKSFRRWLRTMVLNKWRNQRKRRTVESRTDGAAELADVPDAENPDAFWEIEYRRRLVDRALEVMQTDFRPATWKACWEHVVEGRPAAEVARELGITAGAVYAARSACLTACARNWPISWNDSLTAPTSLFRIIPPPSSYYYCTSTLCSRSSTRRPLCLMSWRVPT